MPGYLGITFARGRKLNHHVKPRAPLACLNVPNKLPVLGIRIRSSESSTSKAPGAPYQSFLTMAAASRGIKLTERSKTTRLVIS